MNLQRKKIPKIYKYLILKVKERNKGNSEINRKKLINYIGIVYHIPREHRKELMYELRNCGLIEFVNRDKFKICI